MGTGGQHRPVRRSTKRKSLIVDSDAYREIIERSDDLGEEVPELDAAKTAEEQLRMYQQASEQLMREGGV